MRVTLGPVSAVAARAWLAYAKKSLDVVAAWAGELPFALPDDVTRTFAGYLDAWAVEAEGTDVFRWEGEASEADIRVLMLYWFNVASFLNDNPEWHGMPADPPEGQAFYGELVRRVAEALVGGEQEPGSRFAERLSEEWPGLPEG